MTSGRPIDMSKVSEPDEAIRAADEPEGVATMLAEATNYITSFQWCREIVQRYVGFALPGVVGVFLFRIVPDSPDVDECVWVVVGDLPPAYISPDDSPTPAAALEAYIREMDEWIGAVRDGSSVEELIPVNVPPTDKYAEMLDSRLRFLESEILADPAY